MHPPGADPIQAMRAAIREHVQSAGADPEQAVGIELASLVKLVATLFEAIGEQHLRDTGLSPARWRVLLFLLAAERRGNRAGVTPSDLSHGKKVSKNTISGLLRGLEAQGLIRRALDPADRRVFRIQLTDAGRALIESAAPARIAQLNGLLAGLTPAERSQLADLLGRLYHSLLAHGNLRCPERHAHNGENRR